MACKSKIVKKGLALLACKMKNVKLGLGLIGMQVENRKISASPYWQASCKSENLGLVLLA